MNIEDFQDKAGFTHANFVSRHKFSKFPCKIQARIGPKSVKSSQIFQNRRSHCIEVRFRLSLLREFQKSTDKVGVCKFGFTHSLTKARKKDKHLTLKLNISSFTFVQFNSGQTMKHFCASHFLYSRKVKRCTTKDDLKTAVILVRSKQIEITDETFKGAFQGEALKSISFTCQI